MGRNNTRRGEIIHTSFGGHSAFSGKEIEYRIEAQRQPPVMVSGSVVLDLVDDIFK